MVLGTNKLYETTPLNYIRAFDGEISSVEGLLRFTIGEPDFDVPQLIKDAAIEAVNNNESHYSPSHGTASFRQAIVDYLKRKYDLDYDAEKNIITTVGVTEGLSTSALALLNEGERVLVPAPYFTLYDNVVRAARGIPVAIDTAQDDFKLTPEKLDQVLSEESNVKYLILNYPNNPTGVSYSGKELEALAKVIEAHDIYCVSDEVYSELTYDGFKHVSIAKYIPNHTILLNGLSKSFAMTGYRLGYMAVPEALYQTFFVVHQATLTCISSPGQYAGAVALNEGDEEVEKMRKAYAERRNYLIPELEKLGFEIASPTGAFYLFLKIPAHCNQNDREFALELAREAKVGVIPGEAFGESGRGYVRLSYASSMDNLQQGIKQLNDYLG